MTTPTHSIPLSAFAEAISALEFETWRLAAIEEAASAPENQDVPDDEIDAVATDQVNAWLESHGLLSLNA